MADIHIGGRFGLGAAVNGGVLPDAGEQSKKKNPIAVRRATFWGNSMSQLLSYPNSSKD